MFTLRGYKDHQNNQFERLLITTIVIAIIKTESREIMKVFTEQDALSKLKTQTHSAQAGYKAMYSSWMSGIITQPYLMSVPIDDHMVHRGDGVFEAMKFVSKKIYLLNEHIERLKNSAKSIYIKCAYSDSELKELIFETCKASGLSDGLIRLYLSRGPGGFSTNPYESVGAQLYIVVTTNKFDKASATVGRSHVPMKPAWQAKIKSCNYIINVLMKKESVDRKIDFVVGFDDDGFLTEGSTENIVILNQKNELVRPKLDKILKGTTMMRSFELAKKLLDDKVITAIKEADITEDQLINSKEVMMIGTTLDILPVISYEGKLISSGKIGKVAPLLNELVKNDQLQNGYLFI